MCEGIARAILDSLLRGVAARPGAAAGDEEVAALAALWVPLRSAPAMGDDVCSEAAAQLPYAPLDWRVLAPTHAAA